MKILVINSGSSSLKFKIFDLKNFKESMIGIVEKIKLDNSFFIYEIEGIKTRVDFLKGIYSHDEALKIVLEVVQSKGFEIQAIGHRVVHGGEEFSEPVIVNPKVLRKIEKYNNLAPLHNPANLAGIKACFKLLPGIKNVAVFDTGFYKTIPDYAFIYALPYEFYKKYKIRKYGFHGISHEYVVNEAGRILKKPLKKLKIISCHLGSGCSITATKYGQAIETSMGFTPLEGLTMGTRSGDLDPAIPLYLIEELKYSPIEVNQILNFKSGLKGIFGKSNDMRDILTAAGYKVLGYKPPKFSREDKQRAKLALDIFIYDILRYIGSYTFIMGGLDVLIFTAGIGERSETIRQLILKQLKGLGKFKILVIPTNEELMIAKQVKKIFKM